MQCQYKCVRGNKAERICIAFCYRECSSSILICNEQNCKCKCQSISRFEAHSYRPIKQFIQKMEQFSQLKIKTDTIFNTISRVKYLYQTLIQQASIEVEQLDFLLKNQEAPYFFTKDKAKVLESLKTNNGKDIRRSMMKDLGYIFNPNVDVKVYFEEKQKQINEKAEKMNKIAYQNMKQLRQLWNPKNKFSKGKIEAIQLFQKRMEEQILKNYNIDLQKVISTKQLATHKELNTQVLEIVMKHCPQLKSLNAPVIDMQTAQTIGGMCNLQTLNLNVGNVTQTTCNCDGCNQNMRNCIKESSSSDDAAKLMKGSIKMVMNNKQKLKKLKLEYGEQQFSDEHLKILVRENSDLEELEIPFMLQSPPVPFNQNVNNRFLANQQFFPQFNFHPQMMVNPLFGQNFPPQQFAQLFPQHQANPNPLFPVHQPPVQVQQNAAEQQKSNNFNNLKVIRFYTNKYYSQRNRQVSQRSNTIKQILSIPLLFEIDISSPCLGDQVFNNLNFINQSLKIINVSGNPIKDNGLIELSRCMPSLEKLYIKSCQVSQAGIMGLVQNVKSLLFLEAEHNFIGKSGIITLASKFKQIESLIVYLQGHQTNVFLRKYSDQKAIMALSNLHELKKLYIDIKSGNAGLFYFSRIKNCDISIHTCNVVQESYIGALKMARNLKKKSPTDANMIRHNGWKVNFELKRWNFVYRNSRICMS